ncbi:MAG: isoleucine--tRNA ligase, partial [Candidatus Gracilibacteria bacterium]
MKISGKDDIEQKIGVYDFNETCRVNVFTYVDEWKKTVERMGRWVDMENDYKTMDTDFMESVWWIYKTIYDKGLIYEGHKVVPYCPRCSTPLSNFEVNQGYKNKQDKAATIKFKIKGSENKFILAWTTTPWTLVANLGLAVGEDLDYVELQDSETKEIYVLARDRISSYYKNEEGYTILREYKGKCLVGMKYEPIFDDFWILNEAGDMPLGMELDENSYSVVLGHHVTTESGTGVVHIAPAYGEDDNLIGKEQKLGYVSHIADNGNTEHLLENNGVQVFKFNEIALKQLKDNNTVVQINTIDHSYPHCWRCESPLIYRAISAWYVAVEKIRKKMVANNQKINWTPDIIKNGRFGKWVEGARDWNISRNRYWGSAIPVWQNDDKSEEVCIGSIKELYELNKEYGQIEEKDGKYFYTNTNKEVDIHKHFVDDIFLKHPKTGEKLKRIPEVLDCWFESGAMPYASKHYPFEGTEDFKFPADFIAEGLDQTRGWFYTLLILGTALFDKAPMKNVIVNGTVLAEDGFKMSKSKKNYPDPQIIFDKYGADAMRFYLMNSPVVEAQDFRFAEAGVEEVVKKVILPLWNTYYFFTTYANIDNFEPKKGNIYYVRHGETNNNKKLIVNGGNNDVNINEKGIEQAHITGKKLKEKGYKIDKIVSSPMLRATHTAKILKKYLGKNIEIEIKEGFREMDYGKSKGKNLENIGNENNLGKDPLKIWDYILENGGETVKEFKKRVQKTYNEIEVENKGKNVLFVGHAGNFRALKANRLNITTIPEYHDYPAPKNAEIINLSKIRDNNLDKWLISELNELIKEVSEGFDSYKLNEASKPIVKFMDNLTNWYIRRSRKRFWKSENDGDKMQAYETLYLTLVELTKIIAPFMPFISEFMYKDLTGLKSVHLTDFPTYDDKLINAELNSDTDKIQKIITLGLAWRANNKVRVRQPLNSITITDKLDQYYIEIIKEELNVKEVLVVDGNSLAKQVCKPNGRAIGPKFGKDVKFIMTEAKSGNFEILENGDVKVGVFELEVGDFELVFETGDKGELIEAGFGMVIAMDPNITPKLKLEGNARDIVRQIQEARKEADYQVDDRIQISISNTEEILEKFKDYIQHETLSTIVENIENADINKVIEIGELKLKLKLKK